jgi:hypothetical protein
MNKPLVIGAVVLGVIFIAVSVLYFIEPARSLPTFFPGYDKTMMSPHYKHGIGSLFLGLACFVLAWFQSGKKKKLASVDEEKN